MSSLYLKSGAPINAVNHDQSTPPHWAARKNNTQAISMLLENGADLESKNKWGATPFDNAKFAEHMGSIALLATDAATKKAAETKLNLERKLRPTDEERQAKLASLAADALAAREKNKKRLEESKAVKTERETAAKQSAQAERWRRTADRALAGILDPLRRASRVAGGPPGGSSPFGSAGIFGGGGGGGGSNEESEEIKALAAAIQEAKDAGNGEIKGAPAERLRAAEVKLEELRAEEAGTDGVALAERHTAREALAACARRVAGRAHDAPAAACDEDGVEGIMMWRGAVRFDLIVTL